MRSPISLLHRAIIALAVQDYAPPYFRALDCPCAVQDSARYVATYDLRALARTYGLKAIEAQAVAYLRSHPDVLSRTDIECAARRPLREHEGRRLAAAALRAHRAGHPRRAQLLLDDAETCNPRFDWRRYRAIVTAAPTLADTG